MAMRDQGLVNQVFDEQKLRALQGDMAVGHVRYSTTGANSWENSQPVWRADRREVALAHNGNLVNAVELHAELREARASRSARRRTRRSSPRCSRRTRPTRSRTRWPTSWTRVEGAYSTVVMTKDRVVAFRDPAGLRPLSLGMLGDRYCVASETCAFDIIGAKFLRDVQPGEIVSLTAERARRRGWRWRASARALCVFEHIYFARPDSRLGGQVLQVARGRMGEILAREAPVEADLVIPVPDSGNPAARGFARATGLPQDDGFVKNRYVARTFIQPGQELRKHGLRLKFNPLPEVVAGKRLVVVDDSIVRGNTTRQIVQMLRDAGASEVHMRISRAADPPPLPLRDRHVDARGDDRPRPHGGRGRRRAGRRLARLPVARRRLRGDRGHARDALRRVLLGRVPARRTRASRSRKDAFELPLIRA